LAWTHGAHSVKFGAGLTRRQMSAGQSSFPRGFYFLFGSPQQWTAMRDLLIGTLPNVERGNTLVFPSYRTWEPSWYVQDDWHATRWLTLNLGVRYDVFTPFTEKHGRFSNFDTATGLLVSPSLPGSQKSNATGGVRTDYKDFAPRIGFAASLGHQMVMRGGFGISYWPGNYASGALMKNAPYTFLYGCGVVDGLANCGHLPQLSEGLPVPTFDITKATDPAKYAGTSITATDFGYRSSYLEQFSLQLQKEFAGNVLTAGYVGNQGRHITVQPNINQPAFGGGPFPLGLANVTVNQRESEAISRYNALQVTFQRRFSHGLAVNANYTWAHIITNAPVTDEGQSNTNYNCQGDCRVDNPANPAQPIVVHGWQQYDLGNGDIDLRHRFTTMINYELPFGKSMNGVARQIVNGWGVNLASSWQTGVPLTALNGGAVSGIHGLQADRPNQVGDPNKAGPVAANPGCDAPTKIHTLDHWFNPCAFATQTAGVLGNERRNQVFGPSRWRIDFSASKEFPIYEALKLQFRTEVFNITNTASFDQPGGSMGSNFGRITQTVAGSTPREIQFGLKLLF
jgi:hypothetical protein